MIPMISSDRALEIERQLAQLLGVEVDQLCDYLAGNIRTSSTRRTAFASSAERMAATTFVTAREPISALPACPSAENAHGREQSERLRGSACSETL
jgi:hypothetical protein